MMEHNNDLGKRPRTEFQDDENDSNPPKHRLVSKDINNKCNGEISAIYKYQCVPCFSEKIKDVEFKKIILAPLFHKICRDKKHELLKVLCKIPESSEKAALLNYIHSNKTPLQVCIEIKDHVSIDLLLRQSLIDIFKTPSKNGISAFTDAYDSYPKNNSSAEELIKFIDNDTESGDSLDITQMIDDFNKDNSVTSFKLVLFKLNAIIKSITTTDDYLNQGTPAYKYFQILMRIFSQTMIKAIDEQNYKALNLMLSIGICYKKISSHSDFNLPIFVAVNKGDINIIKMMIHYKVKFNIKKTFNQQPTHVLVANGFLSILKLIINEWINLLPTNATLINDNDDNTLNYDTSSKPEDILGDSEVNSLFNPTLDTKMTVLHFAALNNRPNTLKYLLNLKHAEKYLNERNNNRSTPLLCACSKGNIKCIEILLDMSHINLLIPDIYGNTPLVYATYYNKDVCAQGLLSKISKELYNLSLLPQTNEIKNQIDTLLFEKKKWFSLSSINSSYNPIINIKPLEKQNQIETLLSNLISIKEIHSALKIIEPDVTKMYGIEIMINEYERGSGVLRQFLNDASHIFESLFIFKPVCDYSGIHHKLPFSNTCLNKTGYIFDVNTQEYPLYLPYFDDVNEEKIAQMEVFGFFLSLAFLYNPISLPLSPVFFKYLLNEKITLHDILPSCIMKSINELRLCSEDVLRCAYIPMHVNRVSENGKSDYFPLIEDNVTLLRDENICITNVDEYERLLLDFFINKGKRNELLCAFRRGFYTFLDSSKFERNLNHCELMKLIIQKDELIPMNEWKEFAKVEYDSEIVEPKEIKWLWKYISMFDQSKQNKLIEFVTGSPVLQLGGLRTLYEDNHPFTIQYDTNMQPDSLPITHTCIFTIHVPQYTSKAKLFEKFDLALICFEGFQFI